jgi:hypothetical protein
MLMIAYHRRERERGNNGPESIYLKRYFAFQSVLKFASFDVSELVAAWGEKKRLVIHVDQKNSHKRR